MAKQRYINTHFWDDGYIVTLDPIEKLIFLYLLTNTLTEISGAYEIPLRRIAFDTGIDKDMVEKILRRFADEDKVIYRDGWILICNFIKHQAINPKIQMGIELALNRCPDWIKDRLSIAYDSLSHLNTNSNRDSNSNLDTNVATPPVNEKTIKAMNPTSEYAIDSLIASFPNIQFTPAQLGHIDTEIQDTPIDRAAWDSTLTLYLRNYDPITNSYLPTKIGTVLKIFNEAKVKLEKDTNGTNTANRATTTDRLRATAESIASKYPTEAQLRENGGNANGSQ